MGPPLPTLRLFFLLLLPAVALAAAGLVPDLPAPAALAAALVLLAAVLAAAAADWLLAADLQRVAVRREVDAKLSLGEWNPVALVVQSEAGRDVMLAIRDVIPSGMSAAPGPILRGRVPAGGEARLTYRLLPPERGDYAFGDLHLRGTGPLRLVVRQRRLAGTGIAVRVYPSLRQLRRFDLLVRRGLLTEAGRRAARVPGAGTEFERLRDYVPDDEFRRINWKATARHNRPIVNQFETERSQTLVVLLDAGRLMGAPAQSRFTRHGAAATIARSDGSDALAEREAAAGMSKLDHAINTALLLAYVASQRDDRLTLLAYTDRVRTFVPPARGRRGVLRVLQALYNLDAEPVEPDHGLALQFLAGHSLRRSLVVLFTDVADRESSATLVAHLVRAARSHQVVCVTLRDPALAGPATRQPERTEDLYEQMVAQRLLDERAAVLATLHQRGVLTLDTDADTLSPQVIETYLELKERGRI